MPPNPLGIILTCEHGGNEVPEPWAGLFINREDLLASHRGYDAGALELAQELAEGLRAPLFFSTITRLLIDLNRSPGNPGRFSEISNSLSPDDKEAIEAVLYRHYRNRVQSALAEQIRRGGRVLHLSVHSFTPVLEGETRNADVGLLYDPSRKAEAAFCLAWQRTLCELRSDLRIRRNYPYRGRSDGFTAYLRRHFPEASYLGVELELNQKLPLENGVAWQNLKEQILVSLRQII